MKTFVLLSHLKLRTTLFRHLYLLAAALSLAGCATGSTKVDLSQIEAPPPAKARVFVIRPKYQYGAVLGLEFTANGTHIANLKNLSYTSILVAPGKLVVANEGMSWPHQQVAVDVEGGKTYFISWYVKDVSAVGALIPFAQYAVSTSSIQWRQLSARDAQELLNSTNYIVPAVEEVPQAR